jgi:dihydrolipoamide dehydrogenase
MGENSFDCIVIGAGPGGYVAAIRASQLGLKTAVIEREAPGGVCLNWGCIPSKALLKSAEIFNTIKHADQFGLNIEGLSYDFPAVVERSLNVVDRMTNGVQFLLRKNKVTLIQGHAEIKRGNSVSVWGNDGSQVVYDYKNLIIAAGAKARTLPNLPVDEQRVITYRTAIRLKEQPKRLLVVGAGAIGVEFAYFFNSFGTDVTIVEIMDHVLPMEDEEISRTLERSLKKQGIAVKTKTIVESLKRQEESVNALLKKGDSLEQWSGDYCLVAIGVQGNIENLGLENIGMDSQRSFLSVDQYYRTEVPNVYAIGDIIGPPLLAHAASHEGIIAAEHMAGLKPHALNYANVPGCTYCQPQVASVGLTEKAARDSGRNVSVGKFPFSASGKAVAINETEGMVKVVIDSELEEILGVHIIHAEATELIAEAGVARSHEAIASSVFDTIHAHPTLSEAVMEAMAAALGRPIHC